MLMSETWESLLVAFAGHATYGGGGWCDYVVVEPSLGTLQYVLLGGCGNGDSEVHTTKQ